MPMNKFFGDVGSCIFSGKLDRSTFILTAPRNNTFYRSNGLLLVLFVSAARAYRKEVKPIVKIQKRRRILESCANGTVTPNADSQLELSINRLQLAAPKEYPARP